MAFAGSKWCLSESVKNKLDEQAVVFILAADQDKYKKKSTPIL